MTEYNDLIKQAEEHTKQVYRTKDINVCDLLDYKQRTKIAEIIDAAIAKEYGEDIAENFKWMFSCEGYILC